MLLAARTKEEVATMLMDVFVCWWKRSAFERLRVGKRNGKEGVKVQLVEEQSKK
jgi:hypothetical protein